MNLNNNYYQALLEKYKNMETLPINFVDNSLRLTLKIILENYANKRSVHFNFQNDKNSILSIAAHLFVEFANDIYLNHYDLPNCIVGDKLKRIKDNNYYEVTRATNSTFTLTQVLKKLKVENSPVIIQEISYDKLSKGFVKVDFGVSEKTIKNYFNFFKELNNEVSEFPKICFEKKIVFISKRPLWDYLILKNKIPSTYLPNPREETNTTETKSIPALSDSMIYFTPKYEVCYQKLLRNNQKIKTIVIFDTEADKIQQILQDKDRFGFNLIVLSNNLNPIKNDLIPCWNWYKEEISLINSL